MEPSHTTPSDESGQPQRGGRPIVTLLGNPNTGKSTLFNALTGLRQKIANYPGVTVERVSGVVSLPKTGSGGPADAELIDLPGTYSLAARTQDERVAARVLVGRMPGEQLPAALVLVLDASNLARNLFLGGQALEAGLPTVVALTMTDVAAARGVTVDTKRLSELLGCPVVEVNGVSGEGLDQLRAEIARICATPKIPVAPEIEYPGRLRGAAEELAQTLSAVARSRADESVRDMTFPEALRVLSEAGGPAETEAAVRLGDTVLPLIRDAREAAALGGKSPGMAEGSARHAWANRIATACTRIESAKGSDFSSRLDRVLTHRLFGSLIFLALMAVVFQSIFSWAGPLMDSVEAAQGWIADLVGGAMDDGLIKSFVVDGVIAGVGSVLIFLPQILILFLFIAILEDSGYMARAAFLADRVMRPFGLTGRSFIPMMSGFACAIPAIMATRSIPNRGARFATILVVPLTSCSARLPVYILFTSVFVPDTVLFSIGEYVEFTWQAATMLGMYLLGVVVAALVALVLRLTVFKGSSAPFVIELPTYKLPRWRGVLRTVTERGRVFVVNAGTIIFAVTILIWAMGYFPRPEAITNKYVIERESVEAEYAEVPEVVQVEGEEEKPDPKAEALTELDNRESAELIEQSFLGRVGKFVEPVFVPLGWDWRISTAAIASFPAREVVIGVLGTIFSLGGEVDEEDGGLRATLTNVKRPDGTPLFTLATALSIMVFFALCMQCGASVAAVKREMNSWGWAAFCFLYMTVLAWAAALIVYQVVTALSA